ncbi:MAG: RDD family protein [Nitrospirae bacterium]|nr:RDD family protein [Nitrospirota bacterium]
MMTGHQDQFRFWSRRLAIPIGSAVIIGLLMIGAFLDLFHRIPVPQFPAPVFNLQAAGLGNRIYLFLMRRDSSAAPPKENWWMSTVEEDRLQGESEIKSFHSFVAFSDELWFFNAGMYRIFDGKEWHRFDAPWIGDDPVVTAAPEQLLVLGRLGKDFSLTSYAHDVWERPMPVATDPNDQNLFCSERCPSRLVVFKDKIFYFWLKDHNLYQWVLDGEHSGRVESLGEVFGKLEGFDALSNSNRIFIWYLPISLRAKGDREIDPIGLKVFDGNGWHGENDLERPAPVGLLEISAFLFQGKPHLLINTGIKIEDTIWETGPPERSVFLMGGDLGQTVLRYQERVLLLLLVMVTLATVGLTFVLMYWKPMPENPGVPYASLGQRFVAKAIDTALVVVPVGIIVGSRLNPEILLFPNPLAHFIEEAGMGLMIAPFLLFVYHGLTEGFWGQTLGKRLCGIMVMDRDLKPCTMLQSVIRNLLRLVDGICFYWVGLISIAATNRWQRLGDLAGRTIVVRTKT